MFLSLFRSPRNQKFQTSARRHGTAARRQGSYRPPFELLEGRITPAVHTWNGAALTGAWSDPGNWYGGSPSAQESNVQLIFPAPGETLDNDISGLSVASLQFSSNASGFTISGRPLTFNGDTTITAANTAGANTINLTLNQQPFMGHFNHVFNVASGGTLQIGGQITGAPLFNLLHKTGPGTLVLSNSANDYGGETAIDAGTLRVTASNSVPGTSAVTIEAGARFDLINHVTYVIGSLGGAGSVTLGTADLVTGLDNTSTAFNGFISGAGRLFKNGTGTFTLGGFNTYTGGTFIRAGGPLQLGVNFAVPAAGGLGFVEPGARFDLNNHNEILGSLTGPAGSSVTLGTGDLTTGTDNTSTTFSGVISGPGRLFKNGTGTFTLGGVNTYTGGTFIRAGGPLQLGVDNAVPAAGGLGFVESGARFDLNGHNDTLGSLTGPAGSSVSLGNGTLVTGVDNTSTTFSGFASSTTGALVKEGSGTMTLAGSFADNLSTLVYGGTLLVNGSQPANAIIAEFTGTFGGVGTVGGCVAYGGTTINPGAANPGTLHTRGFATFGPGSTFRVRLNGTTNYDQLSVGTALTLMSGSPSPRLDVSLGFAANIGDSFTIITAVGVVSGTFNGLLDGAIFSINGSAFQIHYTNTTVVLTRIATPADHFQVSVPGSSTAGAPFDVTLTALDPSGNIDANYQGTVTFSSQDPYGATLPADYTFQPSDQGTATFAAGATLYTAGTWDVTATDTSSGITGAASVNVQAASAVAFQVVAPGSATSGTAFDVTVIAVDPYGNIDTTYQGTVTFTSSDTDPGVVLPADYAFTYDDAGMHTSSDTGLGETTLITPGDQDINVTDTDSGISGDAIVTVEASGSPRGRVPGRSGTRFGEFSLLVPSLAFTNPQASPTRTNILTSTQPLPGSLGVARLDGFFAAPPEEPRGGILFRAKPGPGAGSWEDGFGDLILTGDSLRV